MMTFSVVTGYAAFLVLYFLAIIGLGLYERAYTIPGDALHYWTRIIQWIACALAAASFAAFFFFRNIV